MWIATSYKGFNSADIYTLMTEMARIQAPDDSQVFWRPVNYVNVFSGFAGQQQCKADLADSWSVTFSETCCHKGAFNTWSSQHGATMCGFGYQ